MDDRDAAREAGGKTADRLGRQRDLGDEHDRAPSGGERRVDGGEVDLGLAAAGDAVQQHAPVDALSDRAQQGRCGIPLRVCQHRRHGCIALRTRLLDRA